MKYRHPVFIATLVFTAAVLLSSSGCFIFGGGGEETSQEPANAQATNTPAGEQNPTSSDEQRLEDSAYDAIETITVAGARGQLVSGSLNWSNGVIQAIGYGIPRPNDSQVLARRNALIAAAADARANLLGITNGVHITSEKKVSDLVSEGYVLQEKVEGVLRNFFTISEAYDTEDQTATVKVGLLLEDFATMLPGPASGERQLPLDAFRPHASNALLTLPRIDTEGRYIPSEMLNEDLSAIQAMLEKMSDQNETILALQKEVDALQKAQAPPTLATAKPYTGIIIDAVGQDVKEVTYPKIYYPSGDVNTLIYGDEALNRPNADVYPWVGWTRILSSATEHAKVKENPLIIKAIGTTNRSPVISTEDAEKLEALEKQHRFLEQGRVVIVL